MRQQQHIYYQDPDIAEVNTKVIAIEPMSDLTLVAVADNLMRAAGGGEPEDIGTIETPANTKTKVSGVIKKDGKTWMACDLDDRTLTVDDTVCININPEYRDRRRRLHTGTHLCLRAIYTQFSVTNVLTADINENAEYAHIAVAVDSEVNIGDVAKVDQLMRSSVLEDRVVTVVKAKSIEAARLEYGNLLRISDRYRLTGRVRLIHIEGIDLNPCSGLHAQSSNIGPYTMEPRLSPEEPSVFRVEIRLCDNWQYWYGE